MSADIRTELKELKTWAESISKQAGAMLAMLEEHPGIEQNPTVKIEWRHMKDNVAKEFAAFLISGFYQ